MADQQTNLHPKNNTTVDLKPNIVSNNIPDKAVTLEKLSQDLQDTITSHTSSIATNTEDIAKNKADITKNTADITKNTADIEKNTNNVNSILDIIDIADNKINPDVLKNSIQGDDDVIVDVDVDGSDEKLGIHLSPEFQSKIAKNTEDIAKNTEDITENKADITDNTLIISSLETKTKNLETRTKNLEDSKVIVNTGTFDPTSDNPASQKSIAGEMEKPTLMANIVDSHGNKRFVEGNMSTPTNENITLDYGKWSLSGTHLMIVASITIAPNTSLKYVNVCGTLNIPSYILNKVVPIMSNKVDFKKFQSYVGALISDSLAFNLAKDSSKLFIEGYDLTAGETEKVLRIQFDLLIDSE